MEIIADANIFLAVILNEPEKGRIIELTKGTELVSPDVIPYEVGNVSAFKEVYTHNNQSLSPFEVAGIDSNVTTQEIVSFVKEGRERLNL
jgi:hypothetical protein